MTRSIGISFVIVSAVVAPCTRAAAQQAREVRTQQAADAMCASTAGYVPRGEAIPTEADRQAFASESFCADYIYQMVGDERDVDKARRCCLVKGDCHRELAMIFANGWGVPRDYDAATYFLCRASKELAPAEQWSMLDQIRRMRAGTESGELRYCDHVTSGSGALFCEQIASAQDARESDQRLDALKATLAPDALASLPALQKAADALAPLDGAVQADGDRGATAYPSEVVAGQRESSKRFTDMLQHLVADRARPATAADAARADAALNTAYRIALKSMHLCAICGNANLEGRKTLRDAQRAWIAYRDAWVTFYISHWKRAAAPDVLRREILTMLSLARAEFLRKVASENQ
jgi:uncharacterized protein YecT (DUF1311 family)